MSYIVKLCYLPLLNDSSYYFNQPLLVEKSLVDGGFEVNNISFIDNEIKVTVDDTLNGTVNSNLFKSNYNCLLLYNNEKNYFEIYKVTYINFIGGKQISIRGTISNYTIDKVSSSLDGEKYVLKNRIKLNSKCGFVEYGYAYDSVLNLDGTVALSNRGKTDIYKPVEYKNINILDFRNRLDFRYVYDSNGNPDDVKSKIINNAIKAWIYIYCEPKQYTFTGVAGSYDFTVNKLEYKLEQGRYITMPYGLIVSPIVETGYNVSFGASGFSLDTESFIDKNADYIYSIKISSKPPFKVNSENVETPSIREVIFLTSDTLRFIGNDDYSYYIKNGSAVDVLTNGVMCANFVKFDYDELIPVPYSVISPYYPSGFDRSVVSKQNFENYNKNPYTKAHGTLIRISDSMGGVKDYTPFELGFLQDGLVLKYFEALTPDITKIYISPVIDVDNQGLLTQYTDKTYNGLVNDVDLSLPYSKDQLLSFLANNKNYFQQAMVNTVTKFWGETERSANSFVANYFGGSYGGMASAINRQSEAIYDLGLSIYNTNITKDNLKNAPDSLNNVKSNYLWLLQIQGKLNPVIEIYTADEYSLESAFNRFCEMGIKLDKFICEDDIHKYINIKNGEFVGNIEIKRDKTNYKFFKGDVTLYDENTWYLSQQNKLKEQCKKGIKLVSLSKDLSSSPDSDYETMIDIKEEDYYFG